MQDSSFQAQYNPTFTKLIDTLISAPSPPKLFTLNCITRPYHPRVSITHISASNLTPDSLLQQIRSSVTVKMKETKNIYEGEVTELQITDSDIYMSIKTLKGSKSLRLSHTLLSVIENEKISTGDIVYIECGSGLIKRLGRSESFAQDCDIESEKYIPLPKGNVFRTREVVQEMSLHDLDTASTKPNAGEVGLLLNMVSVDFKVINDDLMDEVDKTVRRYVDNGNCEVCEEIVVVEDGEYLSEECVRFMRFVSERKYCPFIFVKIEEGFSVNNFECFYPVMLKESVEREICKLTEDEMVKEAVLKIGEKYDFTQANKLFKVLREHDNVTQERIDMAIEILGIKK